MDLDGAAILLTGATSGIGLATAERLAPVAGHLLLHGPETVEDAAGLLDGLRRAQPPGATLTYLSADFRALSQAHRLACDALEATAGLDLIVNNAAAPGPPERVLTADRNEVTFQVNYLAAMAILEVLEPHLRARPAARVVNVASSTHLTATFDLDDPDLLRGYSPITAYARSKLALVTATCWWADRLVGTPVEVVSVHPGVIATRLLHAMFGGGGDHVRSAARAITAVAERSGDSGAYYDRSHLAAPSPAALDPAVQVQLRRLTVERLTRAEVPIVDP